MDLKGRALDNIVIERFWRTIKYADIYLKDYGSAIEASEGISKYIEKYNMRRPNDSLLFHIQDNSLMKIYSQQEVLLPVFIDYKVTYCLMLDFSIIIDSLLPNKEAIFTNNNTN